MLTNKTSYLEQVSVGDNKRAVALRVINKGSDQELGESVQTKWNDLLQNVPKSLTELVWFPNGFCR